METQNNNQKDLEKETDLGKSVLDEIIKNQDKDVKLDDKSKNQDDQNSLLEALQLVTSIKDNKIEELSKLVDRERLDFKNYRKRIEEEKKLLVDEGKGIAAANMIPILDTVYSAINMISDAKILEGIAMIARKMEAVLTGLGVSEIEALGEVFDPEVHNAIMRVEVEEKDFDGRVIEVLQKGYRLGSKILRHSQVKVAASK